MKLKNTVWLGAASAVTLVIFAYMSFIWAPEDEVQGVVQRIFYPHVASAWVAALAFFVVFVSSIVVLVTRDMKWDQLAAVSAQVGLMFTSGTLVMGMMWGKAIWGTYWAWEPRLTSVMVLWMLYLAYVALRSYVPEPQRRARYSAVLGIFSFLDVPIIYFSVKWWRTLHPAQVITPQGAHLPGAMLATLLFGVFTFTIFYIYLAQLRTNISMLEDKINREAAR